MPDHPLGIDVAEPWPSRIARHARLWRGCFALALVREAQFRAHALTTIVVGLVQVLLGIVPVVVLYDYTDGVRGWTQADVIVVLGAQQAMVGMLLMFISRNMWAMTENVRNGQLDQMLIRPVDAQFYAATRWIRPDQAFNVLTGLAVIVIGLANGRGLPGPAAWLQATILFLCGFVLLACFSMAVAYCAFWVQSMLAATLVVHDLLDAGRYPVGFFPLAMRLALTFVVPLAFAITFPSQAITHGISWWVVLGAIVFAAAAVLALRAFWNVAVRHYASASS